MSEHRSPEAERAARQEAVRTLLKKEWDAEEKIPLSKIGYRKMSYEQARGRLERLAEVLGAKVEEITEFPEGLEFDGYQNVDPNDFDGTSLQHVTITLGNKIFVLQLREDQYYAGDIYVDKKHAGGNHDFTLGEVASTLMR